MTRVLTVYRPASTAPWYMPPRCHSTSGLPLHWLRSRTIVGIRNDMTHVLLVYRPDSTAPGYMPPRCHSTRLLPLHWLRSRKQYTLLQMPKLTSKEMCTTQSYSESDPEQYDKSWLEIEPSDAELHIRNGLGVPGSQVGQVRFCTFGSCCSILVLA